MKGFVREENKAKFIRIEHDRDSMDRRWIWKALEERGLPNKFIKLIQGGCNQFSCRVLHNGQLTTPFETKCLSETGMPALSTVVPGGIG
jgi:hypothetical protein